MKKIVIILVGFLFLATTAFADANLAVLKGMATDRGEAALILSVTDEAGNPIRGLKKEDFSLEVAGEKIKNFDVQPVSAGQNPLSLVLGIDISGSMASKPFEETKRAISLFLDQLDRKDRVALMSFGTEVRFLTGFVGGGKRHEVREALQRLQARDQWTHLYEATYKAVKKAQSSAPTSRRAVILLTDGRDEGSSGFFEKAMKIARGGAVPIFTLGFGRRIDENYLRNVAEASGGRFFSTPEPEKIATLYDAVLKELRNQYIVHFPFEKEPAVYTARVSLKYMGETAKATKQFTFNPSSEPVIVEKKVVTNKVSLPTYLKKPWYRQGQWQIVLGAIGVVVVFIVLLLLGLLRIGKKQEDMGRRAADLVNGIKRSVNTGECDLEFPEEEPTPMGFLESWSSNLEGETRIDDLSDIFLKVDCLKSGTIPLIYKGVGMLEELIVARSWKDKEQYMKGDAVYLWVNNRMVSRPMETEGKIRYGHARVFLTQGERYAIEDLGSGSDTLMNNKSIKDEGAVLLQDGDVIEIGGRGGIRIVYREGRLGGEDDEETTVFEG